MDSTQREVPAEKLHRTCDFSHLSFASTAEMPEQVEIIGQERATRAIGFGIDISAYGYDISEKRSLLKSRVRESLTPKRSPRTALPSVAAGSAGRGAARGATVARARDGARFSAFALGHGSKHRHGTAGVRASAFGAGYSSVRLAHGAQKVKLGVALCTKVLVNWHNSSCSFLSDTYYCTRGAGLVKSGKAIVRSP